MIHVCFQTCFHSFFMEHKTSQTEQNMERQYNDSQTVEQEV